MYKNNSILIIDDQKENIDALRSILSKAYKTYAAIDGASALKVIEKTEIHLILLDITMPIMDGFEIYEKIKEINSNIPVIFITGNSEPFSEEKGLIAGAVDYIVKPYNPKIVCIKVENHIKNKIYRDSLEILVAKRTKELTASRKAIIIGMSLLAEGRDQETGRHIERMQKYTEILTNQMLRDVPELLNKKIAEKIILLAPLHDIGKVCIPDSILLKQGKLTDEEFSEMKKHTLYGEEVLHKTQHTIKDDTDILQIASEIAASHHEKYNGKGYPHGLSGTDIPLSARIVSLADVYDALRSSRPYKVGFSHERTVDIILNGDGRTDPNEFDPLVIKSFLKVEQVFNFQKR